jgi:hypothetical protein
MQLFSFGGKEIKGRKETCWFSLLLAFPFFIYKYCYVIPIDQRNVPSKAVLAKGGVIV